MHHGGHYVVCVIMVLLVCYVDDMLAEMEQEIQVFKARWQHWTSG